MSIILGALGGAADQLLKGMDADRDIAAKERQMRLSADLETEKAKTLALFAEAQKAAPLNRLQQGAQRYASEAVPVEAAPAKTLSGTYATDAGPSNGGFVGDAGIIQSSINKLPEGPDKEAALAQFREQMSQANRDAQIGVQGKTRARTSDEALDAALADAKTNDLQAYAAGRGLAAEKTVTVTEGSSVIDPRTGKVIYSSGDTKGEREREREDRRDARAAATEEARDARQQRALDARERLTELRAGASEGKLSKEERLRYTSLFADAGRQMRGVQDAIGKLRQDRMYSLAKPGSPQYQELEDLRKSLAEYQKERQLYGSLLANGAGASGDESTAESSPATPSASTPPANRPPLNSFMTR